MNSEKWLITGGLGYIGAHIADCFLSSGKTVILLDSNSKAHSSKVDYLEKKHNLIIPIIDADIREIDVFEESLGRFKPIGVIHTAALKSVSDSIIYPEEYFEINAATTRKILESMFKFSVKRIVFSSSAAVYGSPDDSGLIAEDAITNPISPYGASKLAAEEEVAKFLSYEGNSGASLRYFNVIGTSAPVLMDHSTENIVPKVLNRLKLGLKPIINGTDYPTKDGTCVRDYVDVRDVARAHYAVATCNGALPANLNVGTGKGKSVMEVVRLLGKFSGVRELEVIRGERRSGDPSSLCADVSLIRNILDFEASFEIEESLSSLFD
jgi:UDP-glucose 4-epimerase